VTSGYLSSFSGYKVDGGLSLYGSKLFMYLYVFMYFGGLDLNP